MTTVTQFKYDRVVALRWTWRDAGGEFHLVCNMETRHLFYTLRMIWNHVVPEYARVGRNIRLYRFGEFYTAAYMCEAVKFITAELKRRKDIAPWMQRELDEMESWYRPGVWGTVDSIEGPRLALRGPSS